MKITVNRLAHTSFGVEGILHINGAFVCHTCEHPVHILRAKTYNVHLLCQGGGTPEPLRVKGISIGQPADGPRLCVGFGPMQIRDGSILVGMRYLPGVLVRSLSTFKALCQQLAPFAGEPITLTITDPYKPKR